MSDLGIDLEQVRQHLEQLGERAGEDPELWQRLLDDPESVFRAEGFPEAVIVHMVGELRPDPEVSGYIWPHCDGLTCLVTYCMYWTGGECSCHTSK
jgi:hypothetical protein